MSEIEKENPFIRKNKQMRERLNQVSCSFCLAKWKQVTIHLHNGFTHSCHHTKAHKIPLAELKADPSALHNTVFKKKQRELMLKGKRPSECDYCWNIEDTGNSLSDRHLKSAEYWAEPHFEACRDLPSSTNVNPSYVELSFSTQCNFRCSYCSPQVSSYWMKEIKEHGHYQMEWSFHHHIGYLEKEELLPSLEEENNPYIEAFWKWWPSLIPDLKVLRITGGEPLLSENTFKVLNMLKETPQPQLSLAVNSNLGIPRKRLERFLQAVGELCRDKKIRDFTFFTSADTAGAQADYIRNGMDYQTWRENVDLALRTVPDLRMIIMCTYNALSVPHFQTFLGDVMEMRRDFSKPYHRLGLDIAYLRHPEWQSVQVLTEDFFELMRQQARFMEANKCSAENPAGFAELELEKMKRLVDWAPTHRNKVAQLIERKNFFLFFSQHDQRRGTNFVETFPEMQEFWRMCSRL